VDQGIAIHFHGFNLPTEARHQLDSTTTTATIMIFNPHKLGVHKVLQHIPLNVIFDAPYKRALKKAVNIADLRLIAKARAHKVSEKRVEKSDSLAMHCNNVC
jgi:4-hydroxy-L-threonine phosphate dehydrogenase PdxA